MCTSTFKILVFLLQEHNKDGMQLREGDGNSSPDGAVEGDRFNTVWVLDSGRLPFHRAEAYHQFHNGIGKPFGPEYKVPTAGWQCAKSCQTLSRLTPAVGDSEFACVSLCRCSSVRQRRKRAACESVSAGPCICNVLRRSILPVPAVVTMLPGADTLVLSCACVVETLDAQRAPSSSASD